MGFLRELVARSVASGEYFFRSGGFGAYSADEEGLDRADRQDRALWEAYFAQRRACVTELAGSAKSELLLQDVSPVRRGRRAYLRAYEKYKTACLQRWAAAVEEKARKDGVSQSVLADMLGFSGSRQWRFVKCGSTGAAGAARRMTDGHFRAAARVVQQRGWHRQGSLHHIWMLRLMSSADFEAWARDIVGPAAT